MPEVRGGVGVDACLACTLSPSPYCCSAGIFYVKVHHILLVTWKSKARATTQEDMCVHIGQLTRYAVAAVQDASFMLLPEVRLFAADAIAHAEVVGGG